MSGIKLISLTKKYGDVVAVRNVSFEIKSGELFFLLGPSGCGKTTILRLIAGLETPDSGDILFDNKSVCKIPPHRRNTALVFQNYALWPHMTVEQNVAYGLEERGVGKEEKKKRVMEALKMVHMAEYAERKPAQLSGGQQQRVALARALVIKPNVILLDEPLSNLDAKLRAEMRDEIRRIHQDTGITMVYVTHDQREALSMADTIAVINDGKIEQIGTPRELYRRPINRFVAEFLGRTNLFTGKITGRDEHGYGVISTRLGTFRARLLSEKFMDGEAAVCMVRPEWIKINDNTLPNVFRGRVKTSAFYGETEELEIETVEENVYVLIVNPERAYSRGEEVILSFSPEDALILNLTVKKV